ncbi:Protein kinase protein with adenine nucleotide alpha hydrolases-like domain [Raphanus sativus]|nr:Protein kinase protein with adenine nucleotide alpha hydrolases-like domain [Raphanus sativus]
MAARRVKGRESKGMTAIAIDKDKNSQHALKWAIENIIIDSPNCILLHVQTKLRIGVGENNTEQDNDEEAHQFFLPFRGFCARKGIIAKEVLLHDIDIASAIVDYINNNSIANIVLGATARNSFLKKFKTVDVPGTLLKTTPDTCAVFVVSKGKLLTSRSASRSHTPQHSPQAPKPSTHSAISDPGPTSLTSNDSGRSSPALNGGFSQPTPHHNPSHFRSSPSRFSNELSPSNHSGESSESFYSILGRSTYGGSSHSSTSMSELADGEERFSGGKYITEQNQNLEEEVRRLRLELQQYNVSTGRESAPHLQGPSAAADSVKLEEAKAARDKLRALSEMDKQKKTQSEIQAVEMAHRLAEMELQKGRLAEMQARFKEQDMASNVSYRRYSIKDVESATDGFSDALKIGEGGYGPVYKAVLENTSVAIKILKHLNSKISDVGLARLVPPAVTDSFTNYHMTAAAGTFCYIDPEYQQTGMLGVKSDLYSFGVVLLQILTAMPAMGLSHRVEKALERKRLREVLDPKISDWPEEETQVLAKLALQCCELRKRDRPDLATVLLPALSKLREIATEDHDDDRIFSVPRAHSSVVHDEDDSDRILSVPRAHNSVPRSPISSSQRMMH